MITLPWHKQKPQRKVKFDIINAIELKKECNYLLVTDKHTMNHEQIQQLLKDLKKAGIKNVVSFMLSGDPDDAVQVINEEKKKHATRRKASTKR